MRLEIFLTQLYLACVLIFVAVGANTVPQNFSEAFKKICNLKKCQMYETSVYEYNEFFEVEAIGGEKASEYLIKLEVFVLAQRDFHIILSPTDHPNLDTDFVYEIVVGGWGNTRSTIRKKRRKLELIEEETPNILNADEVTSVYIEVTKYGEIAVKLDNTTFLEAFDESPLDSIKYVSFASFQSSPNRYFYDCPRSGSELNLIERSSSSHLKIGFDLWFNCSLLIILLKSLL